MQTNKNVLLILTNELRNVGGIEAYNKLLIKIIEKNFENINIDILLTSATHQDINDDDKYNNKYKYYKNCINTKFTYINQLFSYIFPRKKIKKLLNKQNYNLIIDSTGTYFKKIAK
ncbi:hypothetical protein J6W34_04905 [bacterium]|nr:hypothetical protein [bacterium]